MSTKKPKKSVFARIRNNFIAGIVVLIPIGVILYLTLAIVKVSSKILPKEINPNNNLSIDEVVQAYTSEIERAVQKNPEQYFWFHKRWKTFHR